METSSINRRKIILWSSVVINIGILFFFKYYDFFIKNFSSILARIGIEPDWVTLNLVLPLGISFYTFQAIGYTIDIYKNKIHPTKDPFAFFAFLSFFPQLVAGPIERGTNLLPQFKSKRIFDYSMAVDGCRQILLGLIKKMVIADNCANSVNYIFENYEHLGGGTLAFGMFLFAFQIYGDFSGYSDIAIGVSRLFGVNLMKNFNFPYFSRNIAEYWRRWHISLMTWLRDYIYIPLGGGQVSKAKKIRNTFIVFLISGMWHGADLTYVVWGGYNAVLFIPLILSRKKEKEKETTVTKERLLPSFHDVLLMGYTFLLVLMGWIFFRANDMEQAWHYLVRIFTHPYFSDVTVGLKALIFVTIFIILEWVQRDRNHSFEFKGNGLLKYKVVRLSTYAAILSGCIMFAGAKTPFIYFQF